MNFDSHISKPQLEIESPVEIPTDLQTLLKRKKEAAQHCHAILKEAGIHRLEHLQSKLEMYEE